MKSDNIHSFAAEEDLESTKQRFGGPRIVRKCTRSTMSVGQTNLQFLAQLHVDQTELSHLHLNDLSMKGSREVINTFCINYCDGVEGSKKGWGMKGCKHLFCPFFLVITLHPFPLSPNFFFFKLIFPLPFNLWVFTLYTRVVL